MFNSASIPQSNDYHPFGMVMPGRLYQGSLTAGGSYRFAFQGHEEDSESGLVNYKYRMHEPRLGRFFAVDPLSHKFSYNSPYAFSENRVIDGIELEGLEVFILSKGSNLSALLSGGTSAGLMIGPDGVYAMGAWNIGIETDISVNSSTMIAFYPTMPHTSYAEGSGWSLGVSAGEGIVYNFSAIYSGGYGGVAVSAGFGGTALPLSASGYYGETYTTPMMGPMENWANTYTDHLINLVDIELVGLNNRIDLSAKMLKFYRDEIAILTDMKTNLSKRLNVPDLTEDQKNTILNSDYYLDIDKRISEYESLYKEEGDKVIKLMTDRSNLKEGRKILNNAKESLKNQ